LSADDHAGSVHRVQGTRLVDDIWAEELHNLGQPEAFRDFMQPRARLEDVLYAHLALLRTGYSITFAPRRARVVDPSHRKIIDSEREKTRGSVPSGEAMMSSQICFFSWRYFVAT
jgi:hypothetical protein